MAYSNNTFYLRRRGFTLVELLAVISIISLLMSILLAALNMARCQAKAMLCLSNLRQMGLAVYFYAADYDGYFPPGYQYQDNIYWWGQKLPDRIDHTKGFFWPYIKSELKKKSLYECPSQPYGSYKLQAKHPGQPDDPKWITSTYGYNDYYLSSPCAVRAEVRASGHPWQKMTTVTNPSKVFVFADTLLDWDDTGRKPDVSNNALLEPPDLYKGSGWEKNDFPTTCFRHRDKTAVVFADGHCRLMGLEDGQYSHPVSKIGSVGTTNAPHYVPDYESWPVSGRRQR